MAWRIKDTAVAERDRLRASNAELLEALKGLLDISNQLPCCPDPECHVCADNDHKLEAARAAIANYETGEKI